MSYHLHHLWGSMVSNTRIISRDGIGSYDDVYFEEESRRHDPVFIPISPHVEDGNTDDRTYALSCAQTRRILSIVSLTPPNPKHRQYWQISKVSSSASTNLHGAHDGMIVWFEQSQDLRLVIISSFHRDFWVF
jgi:hypothetical protein